MKRILSNRDVCRITQIVARLSDDNDGIVMLDDVLAFEALVDTMLDRLMRRTTKTPDSTLCCGRVPCDECNATPDEVLTITDTAHGTTRHVCTVCTEVWADRPINRN